MLCGKNRSREAAERNQPGRNPGAKRSFDCQRGAARLAIETAIGAVLDPDLIHLALPGAAPHAKGPLAA